MNQRIKRNIKEEQVKEQEKQEQERVESQEHESNLHNSSQESNMTQTEAPTQNANQVKQLTQRRGSRHKSRSNIASNSDSKTKDIKLNITLNPISWLS